MGGTLKKILVACMLLAGSLQSGPAPAAEPAVTGNRPEVVRPASKITSWSLRLPQETNVIYQGQAFNDQPGGSTASMLYPAPNIAGFIAALITHGVILDSTRNAQLEKNRLMANQVLLPYQHIFDGYFYRELMQSGLEKMAAAGSRKLVEFPEKPGSEWFIESMPVYSMTQDQLAIIIDNAITIYAPNETVNPAFKNVVRVVSRPDRKSDPLAHWAANAGENLKSESARLLAESLDLAFAEINSESAKRLNPQRTVRYLEGAKENMERGEVVNEKCDRVVLKNLRGWMMSVPVDPAGSTTPCPDKTQAVSGQ